MTTADSPTPDLGQSELGEVTHTRIYNAPRELVFECMTTPEHLCHFWGPIGMSTPLDKIVMDVRPGGVFSTTMVHDETGEEYEMTGIYFAVEPPSLLVFGAAEGEFPETNTVHFNDLGNGRTEVITHQTNLPLMYLSPEAQAGMQTSFDKFDAYVTTLAAA